MKYKNVIYQYRFYKIGGVEQAMYEIALKYHKTKDITIFYSVGDIEQIKRLQKLVRVVKYEGQQIECDVFLGNYEFDRIINNVKAKKYYQVLHANYDVQRNIAPKIDKRINKYICVSELVKQSFMKVSGLAEDDFIVCHNPLNIKQYSKCLIFGSFTRLSSEKGGNRMIKLIKELDRQQVNYVYFIFSGEELDYQNKNVIYMKPNLDILNKMAMCDYMVQLSDTEGDNFSTKEAKSVGCKLILTPCPSFLENNLIGKDDFLLDFNCSNLSEIVSDIKKRIKIEKNDKYIPMQDIYDEILEDGKSDYEFKLVKVKALKIYFDKYENRTITINEVYDTLKDRAMLLKENGYVELV